LRVLTCVSSHLLREAYSLDVKARCEEAGVKLRRDGWEQILIDKYRNQKELGSIMQPSSSQSSLLKSINASIRLLSCISAISQYQLRGPAYTSL
jgi:hypothetical protein